MRACLRPHLVLAGEFLVGYVGREVGVEDSTEGKPIVPAAAEVGDVNVLERGQERRTER